MVSRPAGPHPSLQQTLHTMYSVPGVYFPGPGICSFGHPLRFVLLVSTTIASGPVLAANPLAFVFSLGLLGVRWLWLAAF
jgi:hypothetical protein